MILMPSLAFIFPMPLRSRPGWDREELSGSPSSVLSDWGVGVGEMHLFSSTQSESLGSGFHDYEFPPQGVEKWASPAPSP